MGETFLIRIKGISAAIGLCALMLLPAWAVTTVHAAAAPLIPPPVMIPEGDTGWIGTTTQMTFEKPVSGRIYYTLDGAEPTNQSLTWTEGRFITLSKTTTVNAIHYISGVPSDTVSRIFKRAKLPLPAAKFGGNTSFYPSVLCTLSVARAGIGYSIHYTLDGSAPIANSPTYIAGTPLKIDRTMTLRAYATEPGLDDSEPVRVDFTVPAPVSPPQATPATQTFSTNTLVIRLKSASTTPYFRYTLDTALKDWSTAQIVSGDSISIVGKTPGEVITVRTQAWKSGYPPSATTTEKYTYLPAVATPTASKPKGFFYDSATVTLSTATTGAAIRYVVADNQVLGPNSLDGSLPFLLESSTRIRAYAFKSPQPQSAVLDISYALKLSAPIFDKQSQEFTDVLNVCITALAPNAAIFYSHEADSPTEANGIRIASGQCVDIGADSTDLWARVVKDGILGEVAYAKYIKKTVIRKLSAPTVLPATREFEDSQYVFLSLEPGVAAQIRYTTNGTSPTLSSPLYVEGRPILLDSTTKLLSQAFPTSGNLEASSVREDVFVLNPSAPIDSPGAASPFANSVSVSLKCRSKHAEIRYWKGNTIPSLEFSALYDKSNEKPFLFNSTTRLQAVAVSNSGGKQRLSAVVDVTYEIYTTAPSDTLAPGSTRTLAGGFVFTNYSGSPILAKTHTTAEFSLVGFRDASLAVLVQSIPAGQPVNISYSRPETTPVSLYRYANGRVEYLSSDSHYTLTAAGEYFVGTDTLPPVLSFISRDPRADDTTLLSLSVSDNIINPTCKIQSPGVAGGETTRKPGADGTISVALKSSGGDLKGLWYRASAGDFYNTSRLPKDPAGKLYLTQVWKSLNTPAVLLLGKPGAPWDMAGFPSSATEPMLWGKIRADNPDADLQAMVWNDDSSKSLAMGDHSVLRPGMAFWMGSKTVRNSVALKGFRTGETGSDGLCRITLHHGWNQVTSPLADKVYWPITTAFSKTGIGLLKAPWRYSAKDRGYDRVDSLEPWVGYFVYYYGFNDTLVTLSTDISKRLAKTGGEGNASGVPDPARALSLSLDFGRREPLYLGARSWAQDAAASEDEPDLPAFQKNLNAWSQRGKHRLVTDLVRFGDEAMHWNIILSDPEREGGAHAAAGTIKVLEGVLPTGYQAWAISKARGLKFRLEPGTELPWSGLTQDTLSIYAGPLSKLAGIAELSQAATRVESFTFGLEHGAGGLALRVSLPWNASLQAEIWSLNGRLMAQSRPGRLNPGIYRLPMPGGTGSQAGLLRIRLRDESGNREFSRKVLW